MEMETRCHIFDKKSTMKIFNIGTIHSLGELKIIGLMDSRIESEDVALLINLLAANAEVWKVMGPATKYENLKALFWLVSIVDGRFVQDCKDIIDKYDPTMKLEVQDIIAVFLNWGATLKTLEVEGMLPESKFKYRPLPNSEPNVKACKGVLNKGCFSTRTLAAVLSTVAQRLPVESKEWESHSNILLKAMATASLDSKHCSSRLLFSNVINAILESYSEWSIEKVQSLTKILDAGSNNANYFVCCLLVGQGTRIQQLAKCVAYKYIQCSIRTSNTPCLLPNNLSQAVDLLDTPACTIEMNPYENLIVMIDLYMYLLEDYVYECNKDPTEEEEVEQVRVIPIKALYSWSLDARNILKQDPHKHIMIANKLYSQANRMTSYTSKLIKTLVKSSYPYTFNDRL